MNKLNQLILVSIACLFLLSACGQKGPLFLPGSDSVQETEQEAEQNSEDSSEENSEENSEDSS